MQSKLTYVDSNVLIAAATGQGNVARAAFEVLDDPDRTLVVSEFVRLECLPKAAYYGRPSRSFYETFFRGVAQWARTYDLIVELAIKEASAHDIHPRDSLHVAAAASLRADELITAEKPTKPMFRTSSVAVRSIHPTESTSGATTNSTEPPI